MIQISTCAVQKFILVLCLISNAVIERLFLHLVKKIFLLLSLFFCFSVGAQPPQVDSASFKTDSLAITPAVNSVDSILQVPVKDSIKPILKYPFTSDSFLYKNRLFFSFTNPIRFTISEKTRQGKEVVFYSIVTLLMALALIKNAFKRYLTDLLSSYFRTTVRQRQAKEQLLQTPLPSLLFNAFFIISTAIFLSLLFQHFGIGKQYPFKLLAAYSAIALTVIYSSKFLFLKFIGWVFQVTDATDTYIFIVFATNKILGVLLLPFSIFLAFTYDSVNAAAATISIVVMATLFAYRYFLSYISVNLMVSINFFHFILYLAAFEILPLLLINKLLLRFLSEI